MATISETSTTKAIDWTVPDKATIGQRRALYRLGWSRSLVKTLSIAQADAAIKAGVSIQSMLRAK